MIYNQIIINYKEKLCLSSPLKKNSLFFTGVILLIFVGCSASNLEKIDVKSIQEKTKDIKKEDLEELKKKIKKIKK